MNLAEYAKGCRQTESVVVLRAECPADMTSYDVNARILHAVIGISTEAGEMLDVMKKNIFYGKPLDRPALLNLLEEAGDVCWYLFGILLDELGKELDAADPANACLVGNIAKLRTRYKDRFSRFDATHRDVVAEIEAMEQGGLRDEQG